MMKRYFEKLSKVFFDAKYNELDEPQQAVIKSIAQEESIVKDVNNAFDEQSTFGQKVADKVASFGGSWTFIIIFVSIMATWMSVNTFWVFSEEGFDPYPFILLNLVLSTLAALQAPIIMMSQNRQAAKDRLAMDKNYEVSLKTEIEIMLLHQKLDELSATLKGAGMIQNHRPVDEEG